MDKALSLLLAGTMMLLAACGGPASVVPLETEKMPPQTPLTQKEEPAMRETAAVYEPVFPRHEPYGTGIGAKPGRVVWAYDPESVDWDGSGFWWEPEHFDEAATLAMVRSGIASLAGREDAASGWKTLFEAHNAAHGSSGGYRQGQKIAIKANINGSAVMDDDTSGRTQMSYTNPVLLKTLLISMVKDANVSASDKM